MSLTIPIIITVVYGLVILYIAIGWFRIRKQVTKSQIVKKINVTILIPARNEETHIEALLQDIATQDYPKERLQVLVIDDASTDKTVAVAKEAFAAYALNGEVLSLEEDITHKSPKKRALTAGVAKSSGELIITTDADCRVGKGWVHAMMHHYQQKSAKFISGPVRYSPLSNMFTKVQSFEFLSLVGAGAGSIGNDKALMCNGANLAFERAAFDIVGGYQGNDHYASGDDVFLMMKLKKHFGTRSVSFLKHPDAIVDTEPKATWSEFMQQRIRWASKSKAYKTVFSILASVSVLLVNLMLLALIVMAFLFPALWQIVAVFWLIKMIIDITILIPITRFMKQTRLIWFLVPGEVFVMLYTTIAGLLGLTGSFSWKGRVFKN